MEGVFISLRVLDDVRHGERLNELNGLKKLKGEEIGDRR
jgi:hypothetical protein